MTKICFVSMDSYPLLAQIDMGSAGGAEVQQVILAKELTNYDYDISFIVYNFNDGPDIELSGNIKLIKSYQKKNCLNFVSKIFSLWKAMAIADADIYYRHSGADGIVAIYAFLNKKKFIYHIASDAIFYKNALKSFNTLNKLSNRLDIFLANTIIAQNETQKEILKKRYHRQSIIIKNSFYANDLKKIEKANPPIILWVGAISEIKQAHLFLELAKLMPNIHFQMIGGIGDNDLLYDEIKKSAACLPNLEFIGFVPFHEISIYFEKSSIFVNTSKFEGFPNTFIQAWLNQTPVISLNVDPSETILKNRLGFRVKNINQMKEKINELLKNERERLDIGIRAQKYANKEHNIRNNIKQYIYLFTNLLKDSG